MLDDITLSDTTSYDRLNCPLLFLSDTYINIKCQISIYQFLLGAIFNSLCAAMPIK